MVTELEDHVQGLQTTIRYLDEEVARSQRELEELQGARELIAELEREIGTKDAACTGYEERIRALERDLTEERSSMQSIEAELASRNVTLTELQKRLRDVQSRERYLEEHLAAKDHQLSEQAERTHTLHRELSQERKDKDSLTAELSSKDSVITELKAQLQGTRKELRGLKASLYALTGEKASVERQRDQLKSTYESLISDLKERIENQEVTIERFEQEISVTFVDRILFEFGRAAVTPEGEEVLRHVGQILKEVENRKIRVVGHTDDRPIHPDYRNKFPSNWELSSARASAVIHYFQEELGLDPTCLEAVGRSFYDPVATNQTPEGRARNRRVEIIIAPVLE